jgi:hypothetical protein
MNQMCQIFVAFFSCSLQGRQRRSMYLTAQNLSGVVADPQHPNSWLFFLNVFFVEKSFLEHPEKYRWMILRTSYGKNIGYPHFWESLVPEMMIHWILRDIPISGKPQIWASIWIMDRHRDAVAISGCLL